MRNFIFYVIMVICFINVISNNVNADDIIIDDKRYLGKFGGYISEKSDKAVDYMNEKSGEVGSYVGDKGVITGKYIKEIAKDTKFYSKRAAQITYCSYLAYRMIEELKSKFGDILTDEVLAATIDKVMEEEMIIE